MPTSLECGFDADDRWAKLPAGWSWKEATAVATDSRNRVFVFNRGDHPLMIFDCDGTFLSSWGEGFFTRPHGICIGPDDSVYCTDDGGHAVHKFTPDGKLLFTLGTPGKPSDTGATSVDFRTIQRAGPPFHYPCNVALSPTGEIYVCDGYGNARIHKFTHDGKLLFSWGEPDSGPGQFHIPHGIAVDADGTVFVADRENSRLQLFSPDGKFLAEWTGIARPCQVFIRDANVYVAELGYRAGMWPGWKEGEKGSEEKRSEAKQNDASSPDSPSPCSPYPPLPRTGGRVSVFDRSGKLLARWGGGENPCEPGDFFAPHDICVDSRGDVYVAEVTMSAGGNRGLVSPDCHSLQKFRRGDRG